MKLTIPENVSDRNRGVPLYHSSTFIVTRSKKRGLLFLSSVMAVLFSSAQSVSPSTINISGQSAKIANYQFEWSVGESASIITMTNSNLVITSGVLQSFAASQPVPNTVSTWLPDEIKIYPNPTRDIIEINILHKTAGKIKLEFLDNMGKKVMEKQFEYYGTGSSEKFDLSKLAAGQYFLNIQQLNPVNRRAVKKGAFKILKIQ